MILGLLVTQIILLLLLSGSLVVLYRLVTTVKRTTREFFEPIDNETPSPFAAATNAVSKQFATNVVTALNGSFYAQKSGEARTERGLAGALAQDQLLNSGALGGLLSMLPNVQKYVGKNPQAASMLASLLSKGSFGADGGNNSGESSDPLSIK